MALTKILSLNSLIFALTLTLVAPAHASLPPDNDSSEILCSSSDASTHINISFTQSDDGLRAQAMKVAKGSLGDTASLRQIAEFVPGNGSLNNSDSFVVGYTVGNEAADFAAVKSVMIDIGRPGADGRRPAQVIVTDKTGAENTSVFSCL